MSNLFATENLEFHHFLPYSDIRFPLDQVSFLTGQSGSGKSTLFRLLNGVYSPSRGRILYRGQDIAQLDTIALRRRVLLVPQNVFLFDVSVAENFRIFAQYRSEPAPSAQWMNQMLEICCFPNHLLDDVSKLSGGERQRVALAIFLSFAQDVLLLDEPTSALDAATAAALLQNVIQYCHQSCKQLICISHDYSLCERFAEHTVSLEGGWR